MNVQCITHLISPPFTEEESDSRRTDLCDVRLSVSVDAHSHRRRVPIRSRKELDVLCIHREGECPLHGTGYRIFYMSSILLEGK